MSVHPLHQAWLDKTDAALEEMEHGWLTETVRDKGGYNSYGFREVFCGPRGEASVSYLGFDSSPGMRRRVMALVFTPDRNPFGHQWS